MKKNAKFINEEKIEGYVYSTGSGFDQLQLKETGPNSKHPGTQYISGNLDIATDEDCLNIVSVHYTYVTAVFGSGKANKTFDVLKQIIENAETKTVLAAGKENAMKVKCSGVSIAVNDFIGSDGTKVAAPRNEGGFCEIISKFSEREEDKNKFLCDMLITKVTRVEADADKNIPEDYGNISGCVFGFGNKLIPITLTIRNEAGLKYFEDLDAAPANPVFTKIWGKISSQITTYTRTEESAFGPASVQTYERKIREYVVTGTAKVPYDFGDEEVLTAEDVKAMSQERQLYLAEIEKRYNERNSQTFETPATSTPSKAVPKAGIPDGGFKF